MSVIQNNLLLAGDDAYNIQRSLRFRSSASAYLSRTPASAGNRKTWTWSGWIKRGVLNSDQILFSINQAGTDAGTLGFGIDANNKIYLGFWTFIALTSTPVYRDPSAWYHVVLAFDTTQATASNRAKVYINGVEVTAWDTDARSSITLNGDYGINLNSATSIFRRQYNTDKYTDGYLTEVNFIDGQALTPSSFGETDAVTGVWKPKKYAGTYGTNGFYLNFSDNSAATAAAIGKDSSGNGNNWTPNNISVTAGVTYDSMTDVPTLTSATQANFATLNPLLSAGGTTANGNLQVTTTVGAGHSRATIAIPNSGKWYCEFTAISASNIDWTFGIVGSDTAEASYGWNQTPSYSYTAAGERIVNGSYTAGYYATFGANDIIGCAVNLDTNEINWYKNGTLTGSATSIANGSYFFMISDGSGNRQVTAGFNAGQRPFAYTPPTGFVALNTFNLPTPTIGATASTQANKYFDATTYTGNGSSQSITNSGSMQPDLVWVKSRSSAYNNCLSDSVRGAGKELYSNLTNAETTFNIITSFNSNGFSVSTQSGSYNATNWNGDTYVGWQWNAGGSTVTNTAGSISAQVRANTTSGFSVVTYTGTGANATVGHGLGVAPKMVIVKNRTGAANNWPVWHSGLASAAYAVRLNSTVAQSNALSWWNNTAPSSTVFNLGTEAESNGNTLGFVAYCFAEVAGFSRFGSYTGNGSSDGPFVFCGFRPRFVMIKRTDSSNWWLIWDSARNTFNANPQNYLQAESSNAENNNGASPFIPIDALSNGFKIRDAGPGVVNASGGTFIFAAFAENPLKYALAR